MARPSTGRTRREEERRGPSPYYLMPELHSVFRDMLRLNGPAFSLRMLGNLIADVEHELARRKVPKMRYISKDLGHAQTILWDTAEGLRE